MNHFRFIQQVEVSKAGHKGVSQSTLCLEEEKKQKRVPQKIETQNSLRFALGREFVH